MEDVDRTFEGNKPGSLVEIVRTALLSVVLNSWSPAGAPC